MDLHWWLSASGAIEISQPMRREGRGSGVMEGELAKTAWAILGAWFYLTSAIAVGVALARKIFP